MGLQDALHEKTEELSVMGRFRGQKLWRLAEIADAISFADVPSLDWSECAYHLSMAALR